MNKSKSIIDVLDLHQTQRNTQWSTQSTYLADKISKGRISRSVSALLDWSPKRVIPGVGFTTNFDKKNQIKYSEIKPIYSDIISKLLRQEDRDVVFEQICAEFPFLDAVANIRSNAQHEMVFRIWYTTIDGETVSKLLYIDANKSTSKSIQIYYRVFGNVDYALIHFKPDFDHDIDIDWYDSSQLEMVKYVPASSLIRISKYLDHGQLLNLKTLNKVLNAKPVENKSIRTIGQSYQQNIEDFYYHVNHAPYGEALLYNQAYQYMAHQTKYKKEIKESGKISTSQGGCMGNVVYSTKILEDGSGHQYMGGMSIGLSVRLYETKQLEEDTLLLFRVIERGNYVTNWINSFGFGRLKFESMLHVTQNPNYMKKINAACNASVYLYNRMHPLLTYFKTYSIKRSLRDVSTKERDDEFITVEFNQFWSLFLSARILPESVYGIKKFHLLNNLLFEALKDYILLYQTTGDQDIFKAYGSFDMHNQYEFFFALAPDLKDRGFKTEYFSPDYDHILTQLEAHHAINLACIDDIICFKKFMLDRFSSAMNVFALECRELPLTTQTFNFADKKTNAIYTFLDVARDLPNLLGNLFHGVLPKIKVFTSVTQDLLQDYHAKLRVLYSQSYDVRNITVPLKSNLFETDEIGARQLKSTTVHNMVLNRQDTVLHEITSISPSLPIKIEGVSYRVQLRSNECEDIMIDELVKLVANLQKPIEEWELEKLNQFAISLAEAKYSTDQLEQHGLIQILREITQDVAINVSKKNHSPEKREGSPSNMEFINAIQADDIVRLKLVILIVEVFNFINVKSYGLACKKLDEFALKHKLSNHDLINILLLNQTRGGDLYKVSIFYFIARYYLALEELIYVPQSFESASLAITIPSSCSPDNSPEMMTELELSNKYVECIMDSLGDLMNVTNAKVKTILTQILIHLTRKNRLVGNRLIIEILRQEQLKDTDYNLDIYYEVANFVRLGWLALNGNDINLYIEALIQALEYGRAVTTVTSALASFSLLPRLRPYFLKKLVIDSILLHASKKNSVMVAAALKILLNLSYGSQVEKKFLLDSIFIFLISAFDSSPKLSHRIFSVVNNLLDVMENREINKVLTIIEYAVFQNRDVLFSASSFFTKLQTLNVQNAQFDSSINQLMISLGSMKADNIDIALIEFISSSFKFLILDDVVLRNILKIMIDRINDSTFFDLRYFKSLNRLLEHNGNKKFFLENKGLQAIINIGSKLKNMSLSSQIHHDLANGLLAILSQFSNDKLIYDTSLFVGIADFYEAMFQEPDLIVELTAFILKFEFGGDLIAEKLAAVEFNTESQINIIIGLAEIEITTEICNHILLSSLGDKLLTIINNHELWNNSLKRAIGQVIVNLISRKILRETWMNEELKNTLQLFRFDEEDDPDFYADWEKMILSFGQNSESFFEQSSFDPAERMEQINASLYALNELPVASKIAVVKDVTGLLDSSQISLAQLAAVALEKLARNRHYSNLLSDSDRINELKEKLECSSDNATKVAILDTLFWLTVNNHRNTERIINSITLPLILSNLVSLDADDEVIRATLGLLVNAEFTNQTSQTLLPYLDLFIHFLKSKTQKVVINTLELLVDLSCDSTAFVTLDEDNKFELCKQLYFLQRKYPDNDDIQVAVNSLFNAPYLLNEHIWTQMIYFDNHIQPRKNMIDISELNDCQYDLSQLTQHIFNTYYLQPFAPKSNVQQEEIDPNYFEITDPRIPRCTHGAMHASRVTAYVKVLHLFRQEHCDPAISELAELMSECNLTIVQIIHLTQIAALFHDVSRENEGIDHWDAESASECLSFLTTEIDGLPVHIAKLIANTIEFKDSKTSFFDAAISLGLTAKQAAVSDYLRQLVHDADCLDIMRVRKTFKLQFLDILEAPDLQRVTPQIIALAKEIRTLINHQGDQWFDCLIKLKNDTIDGEKANFDATVKCEYEWADNVYSKITHDMKMHLNLSRIDNSIQSEVGVQIADDSCLVQGNSQASMTASIVEESLLLTELCFFKPSSRPTTPESNELDAVAGLNR